MAGLSPRRVNVIPMAGAGRRFVEAGYTTPKPLIPIDGVPMVVRACLDLPRADAWIFICRTEHVRDSRIDAVLSRRFPGADILTVDRLTEGQAATCLLAAERLDATDRITIGACDNGMVYDAAAPDRLWADGADALVWTFRRHPAVLQDPRMYGWVDADASGRVLRISCKVPLSNAPLEDHAVVGTFSFRRAEDFLRVTRKTMALNRRVNSEFYMDTVLDQAVIEGLDVRVLEVERYVCWGTPADLSRDRP